MKATASHRAEKQPRTPDQKLPLTGQCAREPACYVRSRRSPGASKIKQTAQSKLAYFYAALMDQFCTALDTQILIVLDEDARGKPDFANRDAIKQIVEALNVIFIRVGQSKG